MFTAAAVAASADVRAKRAHFASGRSFSATELTTIKRRNKLQTVNALDILSTYLVTSNSEENPSSPSAHHHRAPPSSRTSISSTRESSGTCSPVIEEENMPQSTNSSGSLAKSSSSFLCHFLHGHGLQKHQQEQQNSNLLLPSSLSSSLSLSTSSIDTKSACQQLSMVMLKDPAWNEIARLSHGNMDFDEVDSHGHRCGHRKGRLYDRQNSPLAGYMARKRFISAINRIRTES